MAGKRIKIDPKFSTLLDEQDDFAALEEAILADGFIAEPLVLWKHQNILLDGHRRMRIKTRHPTLKMPKPIVLDLESRDEAHNWIIDHQLSKRNVTPEKRKYLIGQKYNISKPSNGQNLSSAMLAEEDVKSAAEIAETEKISERSVHNAARYAEALDQAAKVAGEDIKKVILSSNVKATTKDLEALAELPKEQAKEAGKAIASGEVKSVGAAVKRVEAAASHDKDSDDGGGYEPHEASKFLSKISAAFGQAVRAHAEAKKILGDKPGLKVIYEHLDEACKALAKLQQTLKRAK